MNRAAQIIVSIIIAGLAIGGVWWLVTQTDENETSIESLSFASETQVEQYEVEVSQNASPLYEHTNPAFSFNYPEGFTVSSFPERNGETILIQKAQENAGLQVFISPFDEPASALTPERIMREVPSLQMQAVQPVVFAGVPSGVTFINMTNQDNQTREVWFVREGYLYQVTTTANFETALERIMSTWKFNA